MVLVVRRAAMFAAGFITTTVLAAGFDPTFAARANFGMGNPSVKCALGKKHHTHYCSGRQIGRGCRSELNAVALMNLYPNSRQGLIGNILHGTGKGMKRLVIV